MNTMSLFALSSLYWLGELDELRRRVPRRLREAEERGDRYAVANFQVGYCALALLLAGGLDEARRAVDGALSEWSRTGYHLQHWYQLLARVELDIYGQEPKRALLLLDDGWGPAKKALLTRIQFVRVAYFGAHARAAIGAARESSGAERAQHLRTARRDAAALRKEAMPFVAGLVALCEAAVRELEGDVEGAAAVYEAAARRFEEHKLALHLAGTHRRVGLLRGDKNLVAAADGWFDQKGVKDPASMAGLIAP
jgi:hypothetical protein